LVSNTNGMNCRPKVRFLRNVPPNEIREINFAF